MCSLKINSIQLLKTHYMNYYGQMIWTFTSYMHINRRLFCFVSFEILSTFYFIGKSVHFFFLSHNLCGFLYPRGAMCFHLNFKSFRRRCCCCFCCCLVSVLFLCFPLFKYINGFRFYYPQLVFHVKTVKRSSFHYQPFDSVRLNLALTL